MPDLHRFQSQYQRCLTRLWKSDLSNEDKESIEEFLRDQRARGTGYARLIKLASMLTLLGKRLAKPFEPATEQDIKKLIHHYEAGDYSFWTRHDAKVIIKQYYGWLNKGKYPEKVGWINTTIPRKEKHLIYQGDLLTIEEINKLLDNTDNPRNKALIAVLAESGARVGEIGNLTIRQIDIDTNGVVLNLEGKTGSRRIRLVSSTPHLTTWLNHHPDRQNPTANLWVNMAAHGYHKPMSYEAIRKIIQLTFHRAGIKKRCHPYLFRHTRISQMAHHLTEFQMNSYFGWMQGSRMPSLYVHISGKDLDEHILRINGMKPGETPIYAKPQDRICPRCNTINMPTALYCSKCAEIVDPTLALKTQLQEAETPAKRVKTPFFEWMQNDPEIRAVLKRKAGEYRETLNQIPS